MTTKTRYRYAATYRYGRGAVHANSGNPIRSVRRFESTVARDEWVSQGGDYRTQAGWREAMLASELTAADRRDLQEDDGSPVYRAEW